ncbi:MAG: succinate dehydrogenase, hydrophobic membrane anchor protein [Gallionellaceae bacterium]|jgi:succinate dehydrogenase / fumarate reductase membrane anchor subunit|nr:succinate dehydrogenase, hydrophobic membrane anchor protein [Gallionellaceae bacterium]
MVKRIFDGAHDGLRGWLLQRISAVVMALYTMLAVGWLLLHPHPDYTQWAALFASNTVRSITLLFLLALFAHAWVGVRDIAMDYVKSAGVRLGIYGIVIGLLVSYAIWAVRILWGF